MDDHRIRQSLIYRARRFIRDTFYFLVRDVLLVCVGIFLVAMASFLFFGEFSAIALSERVFWGGMVAMLMGAIAIAATGFVGRSFGVPAFVRKPEEAKKLIDKAPEIKAEQEKRYNAGARLWFIGMGCVGISALVEQLFS